MNRPAVPLPMGQAVMAISGLAGSVAIFKQFFQGKIPAEPKPFDDLWEKDPATEAITVVMTPTTTGPGRIVVTPRVFEVSWDDPFIKEILKKMQKDHVRINDLEQSSIRDRAHITYLETMMQEGANALPTLSQALHRQNLTEHLRQWLPFEGTRYDDPSIYFAINLVLFQFIYFMVYKFLGDVYYLISRQPRPRDIQKELEQLRRASTQRAIDNTTERNRVRAQISSLTNIQTLYAAKSRKNDERLSRIEGLPDELRVQVVAILATFEDLKLNRLIFESQIEEFKLLEEKMSVMVCEQTVKNMDMLDRLDDLENTTADLALNKADHNQLVNAAGNGVSQNEFNVIQTMLNQLHRETVRLENVKLDKTDPATIEKMLLRVDKLEKDSAHRDQSSNQNHQKDLQTLQSRVDKMEKNESRQTDIDAVKKRVDQLEQDTVSSEDFADRMDDLMNLEKSFERLQANTLQKPEVNVIKKRVEKLEERIGSVEKEVKDLDEDLQRVEDEALFDDSEAIVDLLKTVDDHTGRIEALQAALLQDIMEEENAAAQDVPAAVEQGPSTESDLALDVLAAAAELDAGPPTPIVPPSANNSTTKPADETAKQPVQEAKDKPASQNNNVEPAKGKPPAAEAGPSSTPSQRKIAQPRKKKKQQQPKKDDEKK